MSSLTDQERPRLLICATGSVATVKIPELVVELNQFAIVRIVATKSALHFLHKSREYNEDIWKSFELLGGLELVSIDEHEWSSWNNMNDSVLHIDMCKWADVLVIVPASANTIAKIAHGIADNLTTSIVRAWNFDKRVVICPAMNTVMWENPLTRGHLDSFVRSYGRNHVSLVNPVSKRLACGDTGVGALADVQTIITHIQTVITEVSDNMGFGWSPDGYTADHMRLLEEKWRRLSIYTLMKLEEVGSEQQQLVLKHDEGISVKPKRKSWPSWAVNLGIGTGMFAAGVAFGVFVTVSLLSDVMLDEEARTLSHNAWLRRERPSIV